MPKNVFVVMITEEGDSFGLEAYRSTGEGKPTELTKGLASGIGAALMAAGLAINEYRRHQPGWIACQSCGGKPGMMPAGSCAYCDDDGGYFVDPYPEGDEA
jgi:hypothetical protein